MDLDSLFDRLSKTIYQSRRRTMLADLSSQSEAARTRAMNFLANSVELEDVRLVIEILYKVDRDQHQAAWALLTASSLGPIQWDPHDNAKDRWAIRKLIPLLAASSNPIRVAAENILAAAGLVGVSELTRAIVHPDSVKKSKTIDFDDVAVLRVLSRIGSKWWDLEPREQWALQTAIRPLVRLLEQSLSPKAWKLRDASLEALRSFHWKPIGRKQEAIVAVAMENWNRAVELGPIAVEPLLEASGFVGSVEALGKIGDKTATRRLLGWLEGGSWDLDDHGEAVLEALGKIRDKKAVKPLLRMFRPGGGPRAGNWEGCIIKALGQVGGNDAFEFLKKRDELQALAQIDDPRVKPLLIEWFSTAVTKDGSKNLGRLDLETAATALVKRGWQPTGEIEMIWFAVALRDWEAIEELGERAVWGLIAVLEADFYGGEDEAILAGMKRCLQNVGAVEVLVEAITTSRCLEPERRKAVAWALQIIGDARATKALLILLNERDTSVQRQAISALGESEGEQAIEPLRKLYDDLRNTACEGDKKSLVFSLAIALNKLGEPAGNTTGW